MDGLIKALTIFRKYTSKAYPTGCEHDVLYVYVEPDLVEQDDRAELGELGFVVDEENECFKSFRYGSA